MWFLCYVSKDHPLPSVTVEIQANICVNRQPQQLPRPHSLLMVYFRHSSEIHDHTHTRGEHTTHTFTWERPHYFGVKWFWQRFTVSARSSHRVDPTGQTLLVERDGTVASGEMDGLGDQCEGCEGKAGKGRRGRRERREGGREGGVSTRSPSG